MIVGNNIHVITIIMIKTQKLYCLLYDQSPLDFQYSESSLQIRIDSRGAAPIDCA